MDYKPVQEQWAIAWAAKFSHDMKVSRIRKERYHKAWEASDMEAAAEHMNAYEKYFNHAQGMVEALEIFGYSYVWDDDAEKHIVIENRWW